MSGKLDPQADMLCLRSSEKFVPEDHPLRAIKPLVNQALRRLLPLFDAMYAQIGRPSIPPERLLKAKLLQAFYSIRSEVLLVEMPHYNLLFRWFLDLNLTDKIWDHSSFTTNQQRLLEHATAQAASSNEAAQRPGALRLRPFLGRCIWRTGALSSARSAFQP